MYNEFDGYNRDYGLRRHFRRDEARNSERRYYDDRRREDSRQDDYRREESGRGFEDYDNEEIRSEIDRLRSDLSKLKRTLDERKSDDTEIKLAIQTATQANIETLEKMTATLDALNLRVNELESELTKSISKMKSDLHDDMDELNLPVEAKCVSIEEKVKGISESLEDQTPMLETVEKMKTELNDTLASKFGTKTIGNVLQKLSSLQAFVIADVVGTIMLFLLMGYFILSLS